MEALYSKKLNSHKNFVFENCIIMNYYKYTESGTDIWFIKIIDGDKWYKLSRYINHKIVEYRYCNSNDSVIGYKSTRLYINNISDYNKDTEDKIYLILSDLFEKIA